MPALLTKPNEAVSQPDRQAGQPWSLIDAAGFLGVSKRTIEKLVQDGRLKTIKVLGRRLVPDIELRRIAECGI